MPTYEDCVRFRHILDYARETIALTKGKSRADLDTDRTLNLALVRLLEIIGEAANRVSDEEQVRHPGATEASLPPVATEAPVVT